MPAALLRPRALVSHLLVAVVAVSCVALGLWQLERLATVRDSNASVEARMDLPPVEVAALVGDDALELGELGELASRRAVATGVFRTDQEVLQRGQQFRNEAGFHVLTPLELDGGGVVLVRRGWVPSELSEPPVAEAAPPPGRITVHGVLELPVPQPSFGPRDPDEGQLARVFHTDTARLDAQIDGALFPLVLRDATDPDAIAVGTLPVPAGPPVLDERNHLSYAMQWFAFAVIAVATYTAWLVTRRRGDAGSGSG